MIILFNKIKHLQKHPLRQQGAVLMVMLVILILGGSAMLLNSLNSTTPRLEREKITAQSLAQAKEGLISYAINSESTGALTARPGNFPCPDTDAPDAGGYGDENTGCAAGAIGRLPWKTLGIPELRDGEGEPLWYALSGNFRKSMGIINSDTLGTLLVYDRDGNTLLTQPGSEAVAIVFAPGRIVGAQQRNTNSDKTTASNYLETANGRNNATTNGPFIAADRNDTINDRLISIGTRDFIPIIEKRIAKELKSILENYRTANGGYYPNPAPLGSCNNTSCTSDPSICRGRLPSSALPTDWGGINPLLPRTVTSNWFVNNKWFRVIYYSVRSSHLTPTPSCSPTLTVDSVSTSALFFLPGTPLGGTTRPPPYSNLSLYMEDAENINLDDTYVTPTSISNDQLYILP